MKKTINRNEFIRDMNDYYRGNGFTYDGLNCLYDYLSVLEEEIGGEFEFDVIALHCQYCEMTVIDFITDYYNDDDIQEILNIYDLKSIDEITANVLYDYENLYMTGRIIAVVDTDTIIVDNDR